MLDLAVAVARRTPWAGRECRGGPVVYIVGEGAFGLRKRVEAYRREHDDCGDLPIYFISARANLGGIGPSDLPDLSEAIRAALGDETPALIVFDTLNRALGAGNENGEGMQAFSNAAEALSDMFSCLVLAVHHQGASDDKRPRGHTSLPASAVVTFRSVKTDVAGGYSCDLILDDAKDAASGYALHITLKTVSIDDEETTLMVDRIEVGDSVETGTADKISPRLGRPPRLSLFRDCIVAALDKHGEEIKPFTDGPWVRAVEIEKIRRVYYERRADQIEEESLRKAFQRHLKSTVDLGMVVVREIEQKQLLWFSAKTEETK